MFKWLGRRFTEADFHTMADWLRPYVSPGGVLADLGGGTGDIGAGMAQALGARVIIVDGTRQMLERVSAHPQVSVRLATVEALPFPTAFFDAAMCCDAFHHFRDQAAAAREIARVIRPGGGVLILDAEATGSNRAWAAVERVLGEPGGFLPPADLEGLLAAHGITGTTTRLQGASYAFVGVVAGASSAATAAAPTRTVRRSPDPGVR
jgi:SAM-dependent methyltransferase